MSARDDLEASVWGILTAVHGEHGADPLTFAAIIEAAETYASALEPCASCGRPSPPRGSMPRHEWSHGYCGACYKRWRRHGSPPEGPPPAGRRGPLAVRSGRIEDYADLCSWGISDRQAAQRLGVSIRTIHRYKNDPRYARAMAGAS